MDADITKILPVRRGHFALESGDHGNLWLDLELLCLQPGVLRRWAAELARRIAPHRVDVVCGPLVEGAFVGLMVAAELGVPFVYSEPSSAPAYRVPSVLRRELSGRRVAIVDDVINAAFAVGATHADLEACGAATVVIAALAVLGGRAAEFAAQAGAALEALGSIPNEIWPPAQCPLCASGEPLTALDGDTNP